MITKPQANFLHTAMLRAVTAYGSDANVARNLLRAGLIQESGASPLSHAQTYIPTLDGLKALRDFRNAQWANSGAMAYLSHLQNVEALIATLT